MNIRKYDILNQLCRAVSGLDKNATCLWVETALQQKISVDSIVGDGLCKGLGIAGEKCETGEYFFPQLAEFSKALGDAMGMLRSGMPDRDGMPRPTIVIGVVAGDIHDIGKNTVKSILAASGYHVVDLGRDVHSSLFVQAAIKEQAQMICMSTYLDTTMGKMEEVLEQLRTDGLKNRVKVVVGGAPVTESFAAGIGADAYAANAALALDAVNSLFRKDLSAPPGA